jgi:PBP1b-binding outer membrane lipoprotein LpoB
VTHLAGRPLAGERHLAAGTGADDGRHSRLISPKTHESDTSPFTTQSSRNVPSRTNPSFSRTRADAALRVSVSAWTRFRSSVSNAHCNKAPAASVA